jgi:hypothetical protein
MKSSYLLAMAITAERHGYRAGVVSSRCPTPQQARYLSLGAGVGLTRMQRGQVTEAEVNRLYEFEAMVTETEGQQPRFIHDVGGTVGVSWRSRSSTPSILSSTACTS